MSVTARVDVQLQHDDGIEVLSDDITIVQDVAPAVLAPTAGAAAELDTERDPLIPFLFLGVLSLIAMLAIAVLLAA